MSGKKAEESTQDNFLCVLCLPYEIHVNEERSEFHWGGRKKIKVLSEEAIDFVGDMKYRGFVNET